MATVVLRWLVIAFLVFVLTICGGIYIISNVLPKVYTATAQIEIKPRLKGASFDSFIFQAEFEVIQSPDIVLPVIDKLDLTKTWANRMHKEQLTSQEALDHMQEVLKLDLIRGTDIVRITATSEESQEAADIANGVANQYKQMRDEQTHRGENRVEDSLRNQIDQQQKVVDEKKATVEKFRTELEVKGITPSAGGSDPVGTDLQPYHDAQHGLEQQQRLYDTLVVRLKQTQAEAQLIESPVRIISRAEPPPYPAQPNRAFCVVITTLTAIFLSIGVASAVEIVFALSRRAPRITPSS